jgi:hypothetical protein
MPLLASSLIACEGDASRPPGVRSDAGADAEAGVIPVPLPASDAASDAPSGPPPNDGQPPGDDPATPPLPPPNDAAADTNLDALAPPIQTGPDGPVIDVRVPFPGAPANPAAIKVMPAGATLLGGISVACSFGPTSVATGAHWCAFAKPGATLSTLELWVMNVSKLPPVCDGSSPDCIKLSSNLFGGVPQGGPQFPSAHRFYGDLLIFHADAVSRPNDTYAGPIYAWHPSWPSARKISATNAAFRCVGITRAPAVLCLENVNFDSNPVTFDLTAGRVDTGQLAVKVATISPSHPTTMESQWAASFSSDGKYFLYSAASPPVPPATVQTPETLYYLETEKLGTEAPKAVGAPGLSKWAVTPDQTKWLYLRDFNYSPTVPSGTLYMADFPGGGNEVKLAGARVASGNLVGITDFAAVPTAGPTPTTAFVNVLQKVDAMNGTGEVISIKTLAASLDDPANVVTLLPSGSALPFNSPDLRYGRIFSLASTSVQGLTDAKIFKYDGSAACTLAPNPTSAIFGFPFLEHAALTFWADNYDQNSDSGDGMVASPSDCTSKRRKFATALDYWFIKGDDQLLYTDDVRGEVSTLRRSAIVAGDLALPETLQAGIERKSWAMLPNQAAVLYTLRGGNAATDGTYLLKLP